MRARGEVDLARRGATSGVKSIDLARRALDWIIRSDINIYAHHRSGIMPLALTSRAK
eukprot:SAG31_NODE_5228_length_2662_cov_1.697620_1_plen_56_part_10